MTSHLTKLARGACLCAVSAAALMLPAGAVAKTKYTTTYTNQPVSFSGSCSFQNAALVFSPGLTFPEVNHSDSIDAKGSCGSSGSAELTGTVMGTANCTGGKGIASGTGTLNVGGMAIPVKLAFKIALPYGQLTVTGATSGYGTGQAAFANGNNLMQMPSCGGSGLKNATFDYKLATTSPITGTVRVAHRTAVKSKKK